MASTSGMELDPEQDECPEQPLGRACRAAWAWQPDWTHRLPHLWKDWRLTGEDAEGVEALPWLQEPSRRCLSGV